MISLPYLAGLVDGEGCIGITRYPEGPCIAHLRINQLYLHKVLREVHETFGGNLRVRELPYRSIPQAIWSVGGSTCVDLLAELTPHLVGKKAQAVIAMRLHGLPFNSSKSTYWRAALAELKKEVIL